MTIQAEAEYVVRTPKICSPNTENTWIQECTTHEKFSNV